MGLTPTPSSAKVLERVELYLYSPQGTSWPIKRVKPTYYEPCRSQWPRGLRRRSATARLLRLWVRIPAGTWMSVVSGVCCLAEVSATS